MTLLGKREREETTGARSFYVTRAAGPRPPETRDGGEINSQGGKFNRFLGGTRKSTRECSIRGRGGCAMLLIYT